MTDHNSDHSSDRNTGTVKWFNNSRGYGFISCEAKSEDIFVHYRNIQSEGYRSLNEGQSVEFSLAEGDKGLQAEEVVCL
ncbi:Cold shock protein CspC [gamma proteobacterium IMCC1989]|nr:Cold shock protein CspC [gamma proteobacterium IMCC1989]